MNYGQTLTNKKMSPEVYKLRREIINLIYEAKKLVPDLPRIEVRVAHNHSDCVGQAVLNAPECVIWITEDYVASKEVVFHEIVHTAFGVGHVDGCPLMSPTCQPKPPSDKTLNKLFLKYAKAAQKKF